MSVESSLRRFILENYLFTNDPGALANNESMIAAGIVDSTGIMELILFIEEEFGLQVADEEMIPENLDSIDNLVAFVARKQAAKSA